ncbi:hypothetical protein RI367_003790 [Sorochytrium milnesiophthora]
MAAATDTGDLLYSRGSPPLQQYVPAPVNPLLPSDEEVLHDHVVKIQGMFLDIVDRQIATVQDKLEERELELKASEATNKDVSAALGKAWVELEKANLNLAKIQTQLEKSREAGSVLAVERNAAARESDITQLENARLRRDMDAVCKQLQDTMNKLAQLNDINAAYRSDMKVSKRIQNKLKKEREVVEMKRKDVENELLLMQKKAEKALEQKRTAELALAAQQQETRAAQNAISRMSHEITRTNELRQALEKQWEDSLIAMTKRDSALQTVEKAHEDAKKSVVEGENVVRSLKSDNERLEKKNKELEMEIERLHKTTTDLATDVADLRQAKREMDGQLAEARIGQSLYHQELQETSKKKETLASEVDRRGATISALKNQLQTLKTDYDRTVKEDAIRDVIRSQEQRTEAIAAEAQKAASTQSATNLHLRHENADLQLRCRTLEDELDIAHKQLAGLQSKHTTAVGHYERLYEESQKLLYKLERREMDYNTVLWEMEKQRTDPQPLQLVMQNMQKEIEATKKEKDQLQRSWLALQQECIDLKNKQSRMVQENDMLQTQIRIRDATKTNSSIEADAMKKEVFDKSIELTKLNVELQRLRPQMKALQEQNLKLETDLVNSTARVQEERLVSDTSMQMLKQDLRRVYSDKSALAQCRVTDVKTHRALEQKYTLVKEMLDRVKLEKNALIKQNWELKTQADAWAKRVTEMKAQWQRLGDISQFHVAKRLADMEKHVSQLVKDGHRKGDDVASPADDPYEIVDVPSLKLRLQSLQNEKRHVESEKESLKFEVEGLSQRMRTLEDDFAEALSKLKVAERELKGTQVQLQTSMQGYKRAERIACTLERQLKEAKPNSRIDYFQSNSGGSRNGQPTELEPSTMLLAALVGTVDENTALTLHGSAGTGELPVLTAKGKRIVSNERAG